MKRITTERFVDYTDRIEQKFKLLGNGAYASVYQHPDKDIVVKVFDAKEDRGYARYLKWALKNQDNRFVPKIYGVEKFKSKNRQEEITIVFMEKLRVASNSDLEQIVDSNYIDEFDTDEWNDVAKHAKDPHIKALAKFFAKKRPEYVDFDLHNENYMIRPGTGQIVITDPFA